MKQMRVLNRIVEWKGSSICYEADQRHAEIICDELGFGAESKGVVTPGTKQEMSEENERKLEAGWASRYRALVARANYLAQDRPDIQFATKELCREMSDPTLRGWNGLKRLGRYLVAYPRYVQEFRRQGRQPNLITWVDTDYAGCPRTRRSTSGGMVTHGIHVVKSWSSTQKIIALSTGEAEYYGIVKGATMGIGLNS